MKLLTWSSRVNYKASTAGHVDSCINIWRHQLIYTDSLSCRGSTVYVSINRVVKCLHISLSWY
jgi:hypothetical protein